MGDAYVFDAVRTPRGRGRSSGSLHEVSPLRLAAGVLKNIRDRNDLDTSLVDDLAPKEADIVDSIPLVLLGGSRHLRRHQ